jgi:signal transduction histidine kinase
MSTALLKFQLPNQVPKDIPLDPGILAGAVDASPDPMAVTENGKLLYANRSFAQLSANFEGGEPHDGQGSIAVLSDAGWRTTGFSIGGRSFCLTTPRRDPPRHSDAAHLEIVGRLVGGVAHDFNNLLTGILLYCDLLKTKLATTNPLALKIEEIQYAAEQGAGLIRQLMTVGRGEKDAPRWVSFNHVLHEIMPLLRHLAGEHIAITMELAAGAPRVGLSLAEAQQLILNLVLNARDAMPAGGVVGLETRLRDLGDRHHVLEFSVSDSGAGMNPQTAANIFEPFFTTRAPGHGTGMGLVTVKRVVEDAGGIICVDTTRGKGTRMTVRLPQIEVPQIEVPQIELQEIEGGGQSPRLQQNEVPGVPRKSETQKPNHRGAGL